MQFSGQSATSFNLFASRAQCCPDIFVDSSSVGRTQGVYKHAHPTRRIKFIIGTRKLRLLYRLFDCTASLVFCASSSSR